MELRQLSDLPLEPIWLRAHVRMDLRQLSDRPLAASPSRGKACIILLHFDYGTAVKTYVGGRYTEFVT